MNETLAYRSTAYSACCFYYVEGEYCSLLLGYTGHEMLPDFALINMNGRLYDPILGRFLSPDNYVQSATNPQSYNRYSYCLNNPLKYTDPSVEFVGIPLLIYTIWSTAVSADVMYYQYRKMGY